MYFYMSHDEWRTISELAETIEDEDAHDMLTSTFYPIDRTEIGSIIADDPTNYALRVDDLAFEECMVYADHFQEELAALLNEICQRKMTPTPEEQAEIDVNQLIEVRSGQFSVAKQLDYWHHIARLAFNVRTETKKAYYM